MTPISTTQRHRAGVQIHRRPIRTILTLLCVAVILHLPYTTATALAETINRLPTAAVPAGGVADATELERFLDAVVMPQLAEYHIPGATVAVVKDGQLFFAKGYGYADLDQRKPVIPDQTLFRFGSVGKLFTATAVMQLVEQGKVDLDVDVNTYLKAFQIPDTYPQPITLAHLLTHSAGFEDRRFALVAHTAADMQPLGQYLANNLPARVRPPGELAAYSNHSLALAGYIVEQVSGLPFEQYISEHIFKPLEMQRSTFRQPVPQALAPDLAVGYSYVGDGYRADPFEYLQITPAGALSATATDLAKFMLAHLANGQYGGAQLLQAATVQAMHRQHFTHDAQVSGWTYGFQEMLRNQQRILWHGGDTALFHGAFVMLPEHNVGLIVSYNATTARGLYPKLVYAFLDHYYPAPVASIRPPADFETRASHFTGSYQGMRTGYTNFLKLETLLSPVSVNTTHEGYLLVTGAGFDQTPQRWVEVAPLVFRHVDSEEKLVFRADNQGRITHMFVSNFPQWAFTKLAWYQTLQVQAAVAVGCMLLFLSALLFWPIGMLIEWWRQTGAALPVSATWARRLMLAASALNVLFLGGFIVWYFGFYALPYEVPLIAVGLLLIPLLTTALALGLLFFVIQAWRNRYWCMIGRLHYTGLTVAALLFTWWLNYWNLLGFRW